MMNNIFRFLKISITPLIFLIFCVFIYVGIVVFFGKKDKTQETFFSIFPKAKKVEKSFSAEEELEIKKITKDVEKLSFVQKYRVKTDILNIRAKPSIRAAIIARAYKNDVLEVFSEQNSWGETSKGFVFLDPKNIIKEEEKKLQEYRVKVDVANIRQQPLFRAKIVDRAYKNEVVLIESVKNGWAKLERGGYIFMDLLLNIDE
ncbi:SH3 domain-containing protein [Helicobacter anatolicus]|uniref:SH3 domain-containing protein n=1 Tax=Helicobacter anatolicus TaxID=2905874 RepID=UPI001E3570E7|nr:SH3 domain-containing protein [Helicobacter anatolicus]